MGLREVAAADFQAIVGDRNTGFGWDITLTSPAAVATPLTGLSTDISLAIDPETGAIISGRTASVTVSMLSLIAAGVLDQPKAVPDPASRPWLVTFADILGATHTYKVAESRPDRAIGSLVLILENYRP